MATTLTMTDEWNDGKRLFVLGTVALSGAYPTGGDSIDFTTIGVQSSLGPVFVCIQAPNGYDAFFTAGASPSDVANKVQIYSSSTNELANGNYPNGITGAAAFTFMAIFQMI